MRQDDVPQLYSADEVVTMLRLYEGKKDPLVGGRRALNHLRRLHGIGAVRLGKRYFYTEEQVRQFVEVCQVEPE